MSRQELFSPFSVGFLTSPKEKWGIVVGMLPLWTQRSTAWWDCRARSSSAGKQRDIWLKTHFETRLPEGSCGF